MYRPGKILKSGTWADPDFPNRLVTNRAPTIDMTGPVAGVAPRRPRCTTRAPTTRSRRCPTAPCSPRGGATSSDGLIQSRAVLSAEIWDPDTDTWSEMAAGPAAAPLPLIGAPAPGRARAARGRRRLRLGARTRRTPRSSRRPTSSRARARRSPRRRASCATAQTFTRQTRRTPSRIQKVALMRMGSVTHNFDMDQRFIPLRYTAGAGTSERRRPGEPQRGASRPLHALHHRRQGRAVGGIAADRRRGGRPTAARRPSPAGRPPAVRTTT